MTQFLSQNKLSKKVWYIIIWIGIFCSELLVCTIMERKIYGKMADKSMKKSKRARER